MVKARNITENRDENITGIRNGDAHLSAIYNHEFKCINPSCDAELVLCSIRETNLVPPYFRTMNSMHVENCPAANDSEGEYFSREDLTKRRNGMAAFNRILKNLIQSEQRATANYNWSTNRISINHGQGNLGTRSTAKVKVGPIIYDESQEMEAGFTYRIHGEDIRNNFINTDQKGGKWINLSDVGILIPDDSILAEENVVTEFEIIIIPEWIGGKNAERKFIKTFAWIVKKDGALIETYINGRIDSY